MSGSSECHWSNHFLPAIRTLPTSGFLFPLFPTRKVSQNTRRPWGGGSEWAAYHLSPSQYYSFQKLDYYKCHKAWLLGSLRKLCCFLGQSSNYMQGKSGVRGGHPGAPGLLSLYPPHSPGSGSDCRAHPGLTEHTV